MRKNIRKKNYFFASLKSLRIIRIRIRIHQSEVRIRGSGSGSAPKCHGPPTLPKKAKFLMKVSLTIISRAFALQVCVWVNMRYQTQWTSIAKTFYVPLPLSKTSGILNTKFQNNPAQLWIRQISLRFSSPEHAVTDLHKYPTERRSQKSKRQRGGGGWPTATATTELSQLCNTTNAIKQARQYTAPHFELGGAPALGMWGGGGDKKYSYYQELVFRKAASKLLLTWLDGDQSEERS